MEWYVVQNQEGFSDWIVDDDDDEDDGTMMMMENLSFDFRFLDDDDDDFHAIPSSGATTITTNTTDDPTVNRSCSSSSSSGWNHYSTISIGHGSASPDSFSQQSIIVTDRSDDDDDDEMTVLPHSPTTTCTFRQPASPLTMTSSLSLPYSPHTLSDYRGGQPTTRSTFIPNERWSCLSTNDDYSWCIEAAKRIMISAEVHGKLLMRLRDWNNPKAHHHRRRRHRDQRGPVPPPPPPRGGMTYPQMIQHVPKLRRIIMKTLERYNKSKTLGPGQLQQPNTNITPQHIQNVLQNVNGVRVLPCSRQYSDTFYCTLDWDWWSSFTRNPVWGYHPSFSRNIVLLLVEQRLLHLLDLGPVEHRGRCYTNDLVRRYEMTFHEPLVFQPLGYKSLQGLIHDLPSLQRVQDTSTCGHNRIQWYIERRKNAECNVMLNASAQNV